MDCCTPPPNSSVMRALVAAIKSSIESCVCTHYPFDMISLFLGLTIANLTALLTAIGLGYAGASGMGAGRTWHILAGALAALLCVAVQCVVFTYFMATSKWIRH